MSVSYNMISDVSNSEAGKDTKIYLFIIYELKLLNLSNTIEMIILKQLTS